MTPCKHPMKLSMVSIFVADPAKAFRYYTEVLGFEEVMFMPEAYLAIVKSAGAGEGAVSILLEPTEPEGIAIARQYKRELYEMGMPVMTFSAEDIHATTAELKDRGVVFRKDPKQTSYGYEAVLDDDNGNYLQLIQLT
ncbi:catechol 2,3-dioxygenase-like lactoylglutathione lyase family enzyme [Lewinella marina]|nr:VOC family protein [Neolewinella marina]NJB84296.1 catechol 2,3-dioxygenase-like lactoylglutathione lyase family enzyme [Neolewinella marina]